MKILGTILLILFFPLFIQAQIIHVPDDYLTIQEGIEASENGDTVLVAQGEYFENLNMMGKNIVLCSNYTLNGDLDDILNTIINGSSPIQPDTASCVLIISSESSACVLEGFTIKGGTGTIWEDEHGPGNFYREGGGILIQNASPTIKNNRFIGNEAIDVSQDVVSAGGGAIRCGDGNPTITNNTFLYNLALYGAGIVLNYSGATIKNNVIAYNSGGDDYGGGGIWSVFNGDEPILIENNTIVYNHSNQVGGGIRLWSSTAAITNNIIWGNTAQNYAQIAGGNNLNYNCIQGGFAGVGNIDSPPGFMDESYILSDDSPCIDSGDDGLEYFDPEDPNNPGFALYPAKGTLLNDMGAYGGPLSINLTSVITGIRNQAGEKAHLKIAPNPASKHIIIDFPQRLSGTIKLQIHSIHWQLVKEKTIVNMPGENTNLILPVADLNAGIYVVSLERNGYIVTEKFLKF